MISTLQLKFGSSPEIPSVPIDVVPVTIFVGPNNSGKSLVLGEINQYCHRSEKNPDAMILDVLTFSGLAQNEAVETIEHMSEKLDENNRSILMLELYNRMMLVNPQSAGDLLQEPQSSFQVLFCNHEKRQEIRRIVSEAFGFYFVVDPTNLGMFRIRLSQHAPSSDLEECGIHSEALLFHKNAQLIDCMSHGVKAFIGIIIEVIAGNPRVLIIDEPDAFLHPSLSSKLGYELSRSAFSTDKRVFVSTHSPNFVMGCIQSGTPVNIVRLTYRSGVATSRVLPSDDVLELMRNPLLRSTGVISGLFYEFVVVTESDADRAFYQEINERLLRFKPEWGIPNCLFINAQNKQTVQTILRPLRKLGIPAVGIVDIDVLKEGGTVWTNLLSSVNVPDLMRDSLATMRTAVKKAMDKTGRDMKRDGGIAILPQQEQEAAQNLLNQLSEYGIFVVSGGELESWLKHLNISGHGPAWLISTFEKMGENPDSSNFLKPSNNDVWEFMQKIKSWCINSNRKGIP
jgi:predicted ATPase